MKCYTGPRRIWDYNIYLKDTVWEDMNWVHVAQNMDQWQSFTKHVNEPSASIKREAFLD